MTSKSMGYPLMVPKSSHQSGPSNKHLATNPELDHSRYPNELLRKKLVVVGIPESEHSVESLAAMIPADFNARSFQDMSPDMMAELLLYFITKGIITLPIACERALLDMPWGSHICQFYNSKEDQVKMLVPYFKQGLEKNDACVWLVGDLTVEEATNALAAVVPELDYYIVTGQMQIKHYTDLYTNADGTVKPPDTLCDQFAAMGSTVTAKGFRGLRASGNVSWINNADAMSRFMDYETKVHCAIQDSRIMAVCTYPAKAAALHGSRELIHNHGKIYIKRGEWVHDKSKDAEKIETVFASLAGQ
jgi:MEDS: MEthanogen/methylotroph, DcmR Sensory domain